MRYSTKLQIENGSHSQIVEHVAYTMLELYIFTTVDKLYDNHENMES